MAPRPVLSPFITRASLTPDGPRLEACSAPDAAGRQAILSALDRLGIAVGPEECAIGLGAPDPGWAKVAVMAIDALGFAGGGSVTLTDLHVVLVAGDAVPQARFAKAAEQLAATLPDTFRLTSFARDRDGAPVAAAAAAPPVFSATRSPEGVVILRGPVGGAAQRAMVESLAAAQFGADPHLSFQPHPDLPAGWPLRVMAGLEAFDAVETGRLIVTATGVSLNGRTGDETAARRVSARLVESLGEDVEVQVNLVYDEALDPEAALPTPRECVDRVNDVLARTKITFAPGSTDLDATALRVTDRIANILRECPDARMEIGGHTDSQGRAEMNLDLSQARADAVYDALLGRRVLMSNLSARGYGEKRPVADNGTEDGREANRRIEFVLLEPGPDGDAAAEAGDTDDDAAQAGDAAQGGTDDAAAAGGGDDAE